MVHSTLARRESNLEKDAQIELTELTVLDHPSIDLEGKSVKHISGVTPGKSPYK
jgi:hypothetical protein